MIGVDTQQGAILYNYVPVKKDNMKLPYTYIEKIILEEANKWTLLVDFSNTLNCLNIQEALKKIQFIYPQLMFAAILISNKHFFMLFIDGTMMYSEERQQRKTLWQCRYMP